MGYHSLYPPPLNALEQTYILEMLTGHCPRANF